MALRKEGRMARLLTLRAWLARLLLITRHRMRLVRLALRLAPMAGAEEPEPEADPEPEPESDPESDPETDPESDPEPAPAAKSEPDWKRQARRHEREAKKARDEAKRLADALKAREDADKSEQEKALEQARDEARTEAQSSFEKERRQDRLEVATTKLAAKGMRIGDGDDAKTVKFADPDDALVYLERDIRSGALDESDLFDDNGRVKADVLEEALADLVSRKPHLAADTKPPKPRGGADGGRGGPADTESSVDKELARIRRHSPDTEAKTRRAA